MLGGAQLWTVSCPHSTSFPCGAHFPTCKIMRLEQMVPKRLMLSLALGWSESGEADLAAALLYIHTDNVDQPEASSNHCTSTWAEGFIKNIEKSCL